MRHTKRIIATAAVAMAIALTPAVSASASSTTVSAGGGLWQYGVESNVFSYYQHATKSHTATACERIPRRDGHS